MGGALGGFPEDPRPGSGKQAAGLPQAPGVPEVPCKRSWPGCKHFQNHYKQCWAQKPNQTWKHTGTQETELGTHISRRERGAQRGCATFKQFRKQNCSTTVSKKEHKSKEAFQERGLEWEMKTRESEVKGFEGKSVKETEKGGCSTCTVSP